MFEYINSIKWADSAKSCVYVKAVRNGESVELLTPFSEQSVLWQYIKDTPDAEILAFAEPTPIAPLTAEAVMAKSRKPFDSWVFNTTDLRWEAPVPEPDPESGNYAWDEAAKEWVVADYGRPDNRP